MRRFSLSLLCALSAMTSVSLPVSAQQAAETDGMAAAEVLSPSRVSHVRDLRFGAFGAPATASTITVGTNGAINATGDVANTMNVPQPSQGRGPAAFNIEQDGRLFFIVNYPRQVDITSGSASMRVSNTTGRLVRTNPSGFNSRYRFDMGGRLNVGANQPTGNYSGDFVITVLYF